jgi:hypothetical protein
VSKGKGWDLTSLHSLESAAEWIRKNAGAQLVLVVRPGDVAFAVDPAIAPKDAKGLIEAELDAVTEHLVQQRMIARDRAEEKKRWTKK